MAKHKLHFVQWKYFSLGPILKVTEEKKKEVNENLIKRITNVLLQLNNEGTSQLFCMKVCAKLMNVNAMQTCISRRAGSGTASCLCQTDGRCHSNTPRTSLHILYMSVEPDEHRMSKSFNVIKEKSSKKSYLALRRSLLRGPLKCVAFWHLMIYTTNRIMMCNYLFCITVRFY